MTIADPPPRAVAAGCEIASIDGARRGRLGFILQGSQGELYGLAVRPVIASGEEALLRPGEGVEIITGPAQSLLGQSSGGRQVSDLLTLVPIPSDTIVSEQSSASEVRRRAASFFGEPIRLVDRRGSVLRLSAIGSTVELGPPDVPEADYFFDALEFEADRSSLSVVPGDAGAPLMTESGSPVGIALAATREVLFGIPLIAALATSGLELASKEALARHNQAALERETAALIAAEVTQKPRHPIWLPVPASLTPADRSGAPPNIAGGVALSRLLKDYSEDPRGRRRRMYDWIVKAAKQYVNATDRRAQLGALQPVSVVSSVDPIPELERAIEFSAPGSCIGLLEDLLLGMPLLIADGVPGAHGRTFLWQLARAILETHRADAAKFEYELNHLATAYMSAEPALYEAFEVQAIGDAVAALPHSNAQVAVLTELAEWDPRSARRISAQLVLAAAALDVSQYLIVLESYAEAVSSVTRPSDNLTEQFLVAFSRLIDGGADARADWRSAARVVNKFSEPQPSNIAPSHDATRAEDMRLLFSHFERIETRQRELAAQIEARQRELAIRQRELAD